MDEDISFITAIAIIAFVVMGIAAGWQGLLLILVLLMVTIVGIAVIHFLSKFLQWITGGLK